MEAIPKRRSGILKISLQLFLVAVFVLLIVYFLLRLDSLTYSSCTAAICFGRFF